MIPGWPYSVIAALESGRTSWTLTLDAVRLGPADDATEVTAAQVRQVAERIIACYAQLCLARGLAADIRLPWQRPSPPGQLTPPGSAAGSATSARHSLIWPARRNPATRPRPAARIQETAARPSATTWARPSSGMTPRRKTAGRRLSNKLRDS
jgi:hypothetical protein